MQKPTRRTSVLVALGVAGAAGATAVALIGGPALAEPTPSPSASSSAEPDRDARRAAKQDELAAALATELGIDKAKVAAALEKVHAARRAAADPVRGEQSDTTDAERRAGRIAALETRLEAAVTAGTITADESAAILKAAEAGVFPGRGPGRGPGDGGHRGGPGR